MREIGERERLSEIEEKEREREREREREIPRGERGEEKEREREAKGKTKGFKYFFTFPTRPIKQDINALTRLLFLRCFRYALILFWPSQPKAVC